MTLTRPGISLRSLALAVLATACMASANAASYHGDVLVENVYTLIHAGASPGGSAEPRDWLWFDDAQTIDFELDGALLTAGGPQAYSLRSDAGASADFVIHGLHLSLDGEEGRPFGTLDYELDGVRGTFEFAARRFGDTVFNSVVRDGNNITVYLWGGDAHNDLGIDLAFTGAVVPVPGALLLFGSGLLGLGIVGRRKRG